MKVEILSHFGNDLIVANTARVSYAKQAANYTEEQNSKLINYLVEHKHTSFFRHPQLQFRIECPIYVERQLFKHAVGISVNSVSGRYVDFSDTYDKVLEWRKQSTNSKQGSEGVLDLNDNNEACMIQDDVLDLCKKSYDRLIEMGVAKELCRTLLPLSLNTTFIWTGSLLAFLHMCNLRLKLDTQKETREVAQQMLDLVKNIEGNPFEHTLKAFGY